MHSCYSEIYFYCTSWHIPLFHESLFLLFDGIQFSMFSREGTGEGSIMLSFRSWMGLLLCSKVKFLRTLMSSWFLYLSTHFFPSLESSILFSYFLTSTFLPFLSLRRICFCSHSSTGILLNTVTLWFLLYFMILAKI